MTDKPRLNSVIAALERGETAMMSFCKPEIEDAISFSGSKYDGVIVEMEHNVWDGRALRDYLQYTLSRSQILKSGSLAPSMAPFVRIPPNGAEMNQWFAKQALDLGFYGIVWPHIATVEEAENAVASCRYPRLPTAPLYKPAGKRGDAPSGAVRYWGVSQQEYYKQADVWPLAPHGEIAAVLMIEDTVGISNLRDILKNVPGITAILIGEGDLSQELGIPRQYAHPELLKAMAEIVAVCKEHNVVVGHPHVDSNNAQRLVDEGFRILITNAGRSFASLEKARQLAGRA